MLDIIIFRFRTFIAYLVIAIGSTMVDIFKHDKSKTDKWRMWISRNVLRGVGLSYDIKGHLDEDTDLIIANHQSMIDIFLLESFVGPEIRFVGRKGIMDVWPVGLVVEAVGHITIDREDKRSGVKLLKEVREKRGKKVVIFPEGTRSITGEIQEFEAGAKMVAEKLALKVQAVVIKDLAQFYNEGKKHSKLGNVHIEVLPPAVIKEGWFDESRMQMIKVQKEI
ncbi:MAG: lysophospholipid acyltransferase family protein [Helicobacteraceae bacterium]|jgi:1-acyl-sn-glycerol-3-phosphate acyltransferase|nr:lysophospholipid acyltransferase family protein [Helicobacteraceae bacterium]